VCFAFATPCVSEVNSALSELNMQHSIVSVLSGLFEGSYMRRQSRLFAIAEFLRARRTGITAQLLADRFQVTLRTIYRDLDSLREADLPLHSEQGRGGGYALDKHYSLPPINLSAREAAVLVALGTHAVKMRRLPFTETLESALDKVRSALSHSAQKELLEVLTELQFVEIPAKSVKPKVRAAIEEAWFSRSAVKLGYRRKDRSLSVRTVLVDQVVIDRSMTLLNVVDVETKERRQYDLHSIESASLTLRALAGSESKA
jgi:predicted DNA-binding transcriptional regulator YafY